MYLIFNQDEQQKRGAAYATVPYSSNIENEAVVETTEDELASIFEQAKESDETLDGADVSIDVAIDDPLAFLDYLILKSDEIAFDPRHTRENK
jgi:molybdopterin converting factor small subunit